MLAAPSSPWLGVTADNCAEFLLQVYCQILKVFPFLFPFSSANDEAIGKYNQEKCTSITVVYMVKVSKGVINPDSIFRAAFPPTFSFLTTSF